MKHEKKRKEKIQKIAKKHNVTRFIIFSALGLIIMIAAALSVYAADPGHTAAAVAPGTFEGGGNYLFPSTSNVSFNTSLLHIDSTHDMVGIGTTSPTYTLDVNGDARTTGTLTTANSIMGGAAYFTGLMTDWSLQTGNGMVIGTSGSGGAYPFNQVGRAIYRARNTTSEGYGDHKFFVGTTPTEALTIKNDGDVGIGTTSPDNLLDVQSTNSNASIRVTRTSGAYWWDFGQFDTAESDFEIRDASANVRLHIDYTGNVGIGTTSPGAKLQVGENEAANNQIIIETGAWNEPSLKFYAYSNYAFTIGNFNESGSKYFQIRNNAGTPNLVIGPNNDGNVGIGTTSPTHDLHVVGNMNLTGVLYHGHYRSTTSAANADGDSLTGVYRIASSELYVEGDGSDAIVSIGHSDPDADGNINEEARLWVDGAINLAANTTKMVCDEFTAGSIFYDGTIAKHYGCDGTNWNALY